MLQINAGQFVESSGTPTLLRGVGLGGWMNWENFIFGFPANESAQRRAIHNALGDEKAAFFFERLLDDFFTDADAAYIQSLGLNLVRILINYRHFEADDAPFILKKEGLRRLDRVIDLGDRRITAITDHNDLPFWLPATHFLDHDGCPTHQCAVAFA
ncbi:glycoside hydrolase family 5 protein, partial [bacterium]|nr:glycoside hydrolase family 5 protein [bacterium]